MGELEKRAQKIRELREKAKTQVPIEEFVLGHFRAMEELKAGHSDMVIGSILVFQACDQLKDQIRVRYDYNAAIDITIDENTGMARDVTITWSPYYKTANKCEETIRIGAELLLFRE